MGDSSEIIARNQSQAARILGFADRHGLLPYLMRGCPGRDGHYPLREMVAWFREHVWSPPPKVHAAIDDDDLESRQALADVRKAEADAAIKEVKLQQQLDRLVDKSVVLAELRTILNTVKNRLLSLPDQLVNSLPPEQRAEVLLDWKNNIHLILREMSECSRSTRNSPETINSPEHSPEEGDSPSTGGRRKTPTSSGKRAKRSGRRNARD